MCRVATLQLGTGEHQQGINASTGHHGSNGLDYSIIFYTDPKNIAMCTTSVDRRPRLAQKTKSGPHL